MIESFSADDVNPAAESLPESMPERFRGKLAGLYSVEGDEDAFAALAMDKREALLLLARRLIEIDLWRAVGKIVNVYGLGGVGFYFSATFDLEAELRSRKDFTQKFARHRGNSGGFLEKGRRRASLHFLYIDTESSEREWHAHLDLYGPMGSLISIAKHLRYEHWGTFHPDWRIIKRFVTE
jgi:hypothetical protein